MARICVLLPEDRNELTGWDQQEEVGASRQGKVDGGGVLHHKLAAVAVGVRHPQLGDGDVKAAAARVSADAGAALVALAGHAELALGVLEQHLAGPQPGALQVGAKGREVAALQRTGQQHRLALLPL